MRSGDGFLDQLANHVRGETDAVAAVIEGLAFVIENLSQDERIRFMLSERSRGEKAPSLTSGTALSFSRSMLHRYEVDWRAAGFDEEALGGLAEFCLRILISFLADSSQATPAGATLRKFLARWVEPAVVYPQFAGAVESVGKVASARRSRRRSAS